jgi:hypothetical protein
MAHGTQQPQGRTVQQPERTGQFGAGGGRTGQQGLSLGDVETPQQRALIENVTRSIQVCEWCADQCIRSADPMMVECIRLCEDVAELGQTVLTLIPRQSRYAGAVLQTFQQAVQACAQECSQHAASHCQDCTQVLGRTADAVQGYLGAVGSPGAGSHGVSGQGISGAQ